MCHRKKCRSFDNMIVLYIKFSCGAIHQLLYNDWVYLKSNNCLLLTVQEFLENTKFGEWNCPITTDLPREKVEQVDSPFTSIGVKYFGPTAVNHIKKHFKMGVFFCLSKRAEHLEIVHLLDTDSSLCAMTQFLAIWGHSSIRLIDIVTNFVRANNEVRQFASICKRAIS